MILVTGASTGIGQSTVLHLTQQGHDVLAGIRKAADGKKLEELCSGNAGKLVPLQLDVTSTSDQENLARFLEVSSFEFKGVVNNAGVVVAGPLEVIDLDKIRNLFEVNVFGLLKTIQICLPHLRKSKGRIVNISSISGLTVTPVLSPYCASKHCVEVFSDALRMELKEWGIHVALIEPGSISTPIWEKSLVKTTHDLDHLPKTASMLYGSLLARFEKLAVAISKNASSPQIVVDAIDHALFSARPKTRYLMGKGARLSLLQNWLPDRWRDKLVLSYLRK